MTSGSTVGIFTVYVSWRRSSDGRWTAKGAPLPRFWAITAIKESGARDLWILLGRFALVFGILWKGQA